MINKLSAARSAATAYATISDVTSAENAIAIPNNWSIGLNRENPGSSFLARAYTDGSQSVIAYGGTTGEYDNAMENFARERLALRHGRFPASIASRRRNAASGPKGVR